MPGTASPGMRQWLSLVSSVRDGKVESNCARCVWKTWRVSNMEGVVVSSRHGALGRVPAKCSEDPFLYPTALVSL